MEVVAHEAVGQQPRIEALGHLADDAEKAAAIVVVAKDLLLPVTTGRHVVEGARELDSEGTCHGSTVALPVAKGKT
jgi:hypothetical protein